MMNQGTGILSPPKTPDGDGEIEDPIANRAKELASSKSASKCVRLLTVMAYVLSVSMAAILLSLYYVFLWKPEPPKIVDEQQLEEPDPPDALRQFPRLHFEPADCARGGPGIEVPKNPFEIDQVPEEKTTEYNTVTPNGDTEGTVTYTEPSEHSTIVSLTNMTSPLMKLILNGTQS